jgi:hypothetical protein
MVAVEAIEDVHRSEDANHTHPSIEMDDIRPSADTEDGPASEETA